MEADWKPLFPIFLYHSGMELPKEGNYFVIAKNSIWMHKDTGICQCFIPVESLSFLDDLEAEKQISINLPKIPKQIVWQVKQFFKLVVEKARSDAEVTLYYNPINQDYKVYVPEQTVSHSSVSYKRIGTTHLEEMKDYLCVGTIHSHCDFDAFHSHTDVDDESDFDGLHVTFGNNNKDRFTISSSFAVNGFRAKVDPGVILEGIKEDNGHFSITESGLDEINSWSIEVNDWLKNVSTKLGNKIVCSENTTMVAWIDQMNSAALKTMCGDGPFEVIAKEDDMLVIKIPSGSARLSNKLFKEI